MTWKPRVRRGIPFQPVPVVAGQKQALSPPILGYNFSMDFIPAFRLRARCGGIRRERSTLLPEALPVRLPPDFTESEVKNPAPGYNSCPSRKKLRTVWKGVPILEL